MKYCPDCGTENREEARFCRECQSPLPSPPAQEPQAPQPAEQDMLSTPPPSEEPAFEEEPLSALPPDEAVFDDEPLSAPPPPDELAAAPEKSKAPWIVGIVAGVGCVCIICLAILALLAVFTDVFSFLPFFGPKWAAAGIMPTDTGFLVSINPDVEEMAGFQHLAEVYGDVVAEDDTDELVTEMESRYDISFETDVKPWIGSEIAVAIVNLSDLIDGQEDPIGVIAAATRDRGASDAFLEKIRASLEADGYEVTEATYQGTTYYVQQSELDWETPIVFGSVKKWVILASSVDTMNSVIDVSQGNADSLAKNERYTRLLQVLPDDAVGLVFYDMTDIMAPLLADSGVELPPETTKQLETFHTVGVAVGLDTEGIKLDLITLFDPDALSPEQLQSMSSDANPGRILQQIPHDALGFSSGQNLAATWASYINNMQNNPDFATQLEDLEASMGLSIDEELLAWTTGEYALAVVQSPQAAEIPIGVFATLEVDAPEAAQTKMGELAGLLEDMGYVFQAEDVGGVEMQIVDDPYMGITLGYGFSEQHLVIGLMRDALEIAVDDGITPVADDETFKRVQSHLPRNNRGYFYLNVAEIWKLVYGSAAESDKGLYDEDVGPFVEPIKAIGFAGSIVDPQDGFGRATIFIYVP